MTAKTKTYKLELRQDYEDSLENHLYYLNGLLSMLAIDATNSLQNEGLNVTAPIREKCLCLAEHLAYEAGRLYQAIFTEKLD